MRPDPDLDVCDESELSRCAADDFLVSWNGRLSVRGSVLHRTTRRSSPQSCWSSCFGSRIVPARTMRSLRIWSLTLPTSGTLLHATGTVHNAARYNVRPLTVGRCGWVDGKRWRLTFGARISGGRVLYRIVGRRGDRVRSAVNYKNPVSNTVTFTEG